MSHRGIVPFMRDTLTQRVAQIRAELDVAAAKAGTPAGGARIVAATKYVDAPGVAQLVHAGVTEIGENRLSSLVDKQSDPICDVLSGVVWQFIGRVQSRDVPHLCERVSRIHSLQSESAVQKLVAWKAATGRDLPDLLVQVNVADDAAKDGVAPARLNAFLDALPDEIQIAGLMTMPEFSDDPERSRGAFAGLRELAETGRESFAGRHSLTELSMGTSQDYLVAAGEGATLVRLGRVLYAPLLDD